MSSPEKPESIENLEKHFKEFYDVFNENIAEYQSMVQLCQHIDERDKLDKNQRKYLIFTFLPRLTMRILRAKVLDELLTSKFVDFLKRIVEIALDEIPKQSTLYSDILVAVLDLSSIFFHSSIEYSSEERRDDEESYAQTPRRSFRGRNKAYYDVVNYFGKIKGFDSILSQMADENCPLSNMASYLSIIRNIRNHDHLNVKKFEEMVILIVNNVIPNIKNISLDQLKSAKKTDLEIIVKSLTEITQMSEMESETASELNEQLSLDLAVKCLQSGVLEKRLYALSHTCSIDRKSVV